MKANLLTQLLVYTIIIFGIAVYQTLAGDRGKVVGAQIALIGGAWQGAEYQFGLEVAMQPGWHTYWHNPGASGIPPKLTWERSRNVKRVRMMWPMPKQITLAGGTVNGYEGKLTIPMLVEPVDARYPSTLKVKFELGICAQICVPTIALLDSTVSPLTSAIKKGQRAVAQAIFDSPRPIQEAPWLLGARLVSERKRQSVAIIALRAPSNTNRRSIFFHVPDMFALGQVQEQMLEHNGKKLHQFSQRFESSAEADARKNRLEILLTLGHKNYSIVVGEVQQR